MMSDWEFDKQMIASNFGYTKHRLSDASTFDKITGYFFFHFLSIILNLI